MKKYLALALALAMTLSLVSCGSKTTPGTSSSSAGSSAAVSEPVAPPEDDVWSSTDENGNLKLTERDDTGANGMVTTANVYATMAGLEVLEEPDTALVTLREGKFHQIKRMLAHQGKPVRYLKRLSMGGLTLDPALGPGEWRYLKEEEIDLLWSKSTK